MAHLKGQHVNLLLKRGSSYGVIASSTNCSLDITANTADAAAKDDPGNGIFDNPEFTNYLWSASNESFIVDINYLAYLLDLVINGNGEVDVQFGNDLIYSNKFAKQGRAIISSLTVDAANGDFVKLSLSLDGNGELTSLESAITVTPVSSILPKINGKALMIAMRTGTGITPDWQTIACASSHKLTVSLNLNDITDKDYNDKTVLKEVTGKSVSLSTENLIGLVGTAPTTGTGIQKLYDLITNGTPVKVAFGYYPNSIGQSIHYGTGTHDDGWGDPETTLLEGDFIVTSLSTSGANKEDATFSAEFKNKGAVTVAKPANKTSEE